MISSWRRRRSAGRRAGTEQLHLDGGAGDIELMIPSHFRCPISLDLMKDPVTLTTGITYDRQSIETWVESGNVTCPITNQVLRNLEPIPNHTIRKMIQDWCVQNQAYGIERIPTPRIPISAVEASEILSKITEASERRDHDKCTEFVMKIKASMKESERNKRCIVNNGAGKALSAAFEAFSSSKNADFNDNGEGILSELLSALTLIFPLDEEAKCVLGLESPLHCMVRFLEAGDLSRRRNSILVIKQVISSNQKKIAAMAGMEGALEAIVKLIKEPICPTSTKASLMVIYHMVSSSSFSNDKIRERFVEMGLVSLLLEMLVGTERSVCDKALGVLDGICSCKKGREKAYEHALTMPVLVKKILRVSDSATEFSVSILWKLACRNEDEDEDRNEKIIKVAVEALQVGAFQKLLLLLQVGCGERVKEKTSDLLKVLNLHRGRVECIDSMDFKDLKRPF